ncbi:unnamed protein product [Owenia fusiformis]|uniref:Uncharacterized protein n=1 Tax=Owenia fusiformis TaxID=6347 RepID=A0A8J1UGP0_OWEFU|nr:unnamed protein product [Owenia fusiformis]
MYEYKATIMCDVQFDCCKVVTTAACNGHKKCLENLLKAGRTPDIADRDGWTPLAWASHNGNQDCVDILLKHGANVNLQDQDGWSPLLKAASEGNLNIVKTLLQNGVCLHRKNCPCSGNYENLLNIFEMGVTIFCDATLVKMLVICGCDIHVIDKWIRRGKILPKLLQVNQNLLEQLCEVRCFPRSLSHIARQAIIQNMRFPLRASIIELPLPSALKSYLMFPELDSLDISPKLTFAETLSLI